MGQPLKNIYPHATAWQLFKYKVSIFFRKLFITIGFIGLIVATFYLGGRLNPATVITQAEVIKEIEIKAPIMAKIAKCESPTGHWKNGQVSLGANKDGSVDIGKYQINNKYWGKEATEMGLNLMVEEDNEAFAMWLYKTHGTEPWVWSKPCWNK